jgi:protein-L-isoaspartate(D-aspartate) O-methyltransferase
MDKDFTAERELMVEHQMRNRGIQDPRVLEAMSRVPRHEFVPEHMLPHAYNDEPLPIGEGQTISQPYIVAYMTEVLKIGNDDRVLEIGTGSGYQTAVLAEIAQLVFSVELIASLSQRAQKTLRRLEYSNVQYRIGDGSQGWQENAPYDAIMVTAAPSRVPDALENQLKLGGRMILPVGETCQDLLLLTRERKKMKRKTLIPVRFVPLVMEK